ncbi:MULTISPECIES: M15 family metallopeptidase [Leeia]|uniref:M15 family metallopeptidase n=1 Tax=Leeia aquatica TaxID=2725557 RepID=A0A847RVP3_9NEIS|nr:M15 family metallopeptidase [Leeia aquatica]NLR73891.1 M15 family metallopeptidase [Leeia aquatica]
MAIFRQKKVSKKQQPVLSVKSAVVGEIIRTAMLLDAQLLPPAYRLVIFEAILKHYPELPLRDINQLEQQAAAVGAVSPEHPAQQRMGELQQWIKDDPQRIFTLLVGLAANRGDEYAWSLLQG